MTNKKENLPEIINDKDVQIVQHSPMEMVQSFLKAGGDPGLIEKMMELQDRHDMKLAKKAFISAMAEFKKEPIKILKDKENKQYNSRYSSIDAIISPCIPRMGVCGLSHKWEFDPQIDQKFITGRCIVTHRDGYSDSVQMASPIDVSGAKNPIQQIKSTRTYIKIETFTSLMGLTSSEDVDDDGNSSNLKLIDEKQVSELTDLINEKVTDLKDFLKYVGVKSIEELHAVKFNKVKADLESIKI